MQIGKLVRKWQRILKLSEWDISYMIEHPATMDGNGARANICLERKAALITVCDPDIPDAPDIFTNQDPEHYVVHELLHLHFDTFFPGDRTSLEYKMAEQCVDQLATVLLALDRRKNG